MVTDPLPGVTGTFLVAHVSWGRQMEVIFLPRQTQVVNTQVICQLGFWFSGGEEGKLLFTEITWFRKFTGYERANGMHYALDKSNKTRRLTYHPSPILPTV